MIVRERKNEFVMIEQDNHAHLSGVMMANWKESFFRGNTFRKSVEYAITNHDYGWKPSDQHPFWDDQRQAPYSFINFPTPSKVLLYQHGIDEVEKVDPYAGLLCSQHYTNFIQRDPSDVGQTFVQKEKMRRQRIIDSFKSFDLKLFDFHYGILQLCDNLSLYICLNEPNTPPQDVHPFFKNGIPLASSLNIFEQDFLKLHWIDTNTIKISEFPFKNEVNMSLAQKRIAKKSITDKGLIMSYQDTPFQQINIRFVNDKM